MDGQVESYVKLKLSIGVVGCCVTSVISFGRRTGEILILRYLSERWYKLIQGCLQIKAILYQ